MRIVYHESTSIIPASIESTVGASGSELSAVGLLGAGDERCWGEGEAEAEGERRSE